MVKYDESMVVSVWSVMVSQWFCVRPTSNKRFLKIAQVTMKHDLLGCHVRKHGGGRFIPSGHHI
jgi:hypothetical protein